MKLSVFSRFMIIGILLLIQEGQAASMLGRARALAGAGQHLFNATRRLYSSIAAGGMTDVTNDVSPNPTQIFIEEVLNQPDGAPLNEGALKGLSNWTNIEWVHLSIAFDSEGNVPKNIRCTPRILASLNAHPAQMNAMPKMSILSMLYYAPVEYYEPWIVFLLQHGSFQYNETQVRFALSQLIADIILLFDLSVDVQGIARDPEFAAEILHAKKSLQKSYRYHIDHPVKDGKEYSLRTWIHEELADERSRVIEKIEQELGASIDAELTKSALQQTLKADRDTAWQKDRKPELTGDREYMRRKVFALGYNFKQPIGIFPPRPTFDTAIKYGDPAGEKLVVPSNVYWSTFPIAYNNVLSHEMAHYYMDHAGFRCDVVAKIDRAELSDEQKLRCGLLLGRFQEKEADILAGLHAGPSSCSASAFILKMLPYFPEEANLLFNVPGPIRAAALLDFSKLIIDEDRHRIPFKLPRIEKSPFAKWLNTKCEHPREV